MRAQQQLWRVVRSWIIAAMVGDVFIVVESCALGWWPIVVAAGLGILGAGVALWDAQRALRILRNCSR